jgi:hypothetical protein
VAQPGLPWRGFDSRPAIRGGNMIEALDVMARSFLGTLRFIAVAYMVGHFFAIV